MKFTNETTNTILKTLQQALLNLKEKEILTFEVINPDVESSTYNGTKISLNDKIYVYRGYKSWIDLAHILKCKMLTPILQTNQNFVQIRYEKLNEDVSFHKNVDKEEKYGSGSIFSNINKNDEFSFLHYFTQALKNVNINKRLNILNLGVNNGDEFELIKEYATNFKNLKMVGIDYCSSAIKEAESKFEKDKNIVFYNADITKLQNLNLDKFDLIITIGTLQSSNLNFNKTLMDITQNYLKKDGTIILGFPNCRWIDGEMVYGAKVKNYPFSEMGLLYKDVIFSKKYLQQKQFRVTITGKDYIFLTATSIR